MRDSLRLPSARQARKAAGAAMLVGLLGCASAEPSAHDDAAPRVVGRRSVQMLRAAPQDGGAAPGNVDAHLARMLSRTPANVRVEQRDGLTQVRIVGGFQHATFVTASADAGLERSCSSDADEARALLQRSDR